METTLFTHPACIQHDTGYGHPECSARLRVVLEGLEDLSCGHISVPVATRAQISLVHSPYYIERLLAVLPKQGYVALDSDTIISPASGEAVFRASGALCAAVDWVMQQTERAAFCAVRPPGHHAMPEYAMGFCLFNHIAIGATHAFQCHGLKRVAIVDFDVHHGNGTQAMFEDEPQIFYASSHQIPLFPGTGTEYERGNHNNMLNVPLPPFSGSDVFRERFEECILPALDRFRPELLMISAGFDAHIDDPLANICLVEDDFVWVTQRLLEKAHQYCHGRIVSTLEGGYHLTALAQSCTAHIRTLLKG